MMKNWQYTQGRSYLDASVILLATWWFFAWQPPLRCARSPLSLFPGLTPQKYKVTQTSSRPFQPLPLPPQHSTSNPSGPHLWLFCETIRQQATCCRPARETKKEHCTTLQQLSVVRQITCPCPPFTEQRSSRTENNLTGTRIFVDTYLDYIHLPSFVHFLHPPGRLTPYVTRLPRICLTSRFVH